MINIAVEKLTVLDQARELVPIYAENFSGMKDPSQIFQWMVGKLMSKDISQYFAAKPEAEGDLHGISLEDMIGYVLWTQVGGFRKEVFLELEQIAVLKRFQGQGIGPRLIIGSLPLLKKCLRKRGAWISTIKVTTGASNERAIKVYEDTLGAKIEHRVKSPYHPGQIEVEMFAYFTDPNW